MTFKEWFEKKSGWGPLEGGAEDRLAKDAWNAALEEAIKLADDSLKDCCCEECTNALSGQMRELKK